MTPSVPFVTEFSVVCDKEKLRIGEGHASVGKGL